MEPGYAAFLKGLWNNPRGVSSPTPSSIVLAAMIAAQVDPMVPGSVIELGAGTGAVTAALLTRGFTADRIIAIESEPVLASAVARRCPGIRVLCQDAFAFGSLVPLDLPISAVVSGLPLLHFHQKQRQALLERAFVRQGADKRFVQLSYSPRPPITAPEGVSVNGILVLRNLPPAHVWTYRAGAPAAMN